MPATTFPEYVASINRTINELVSSAEARLINLHIDQRSMLRGFIGGVLAFDDDSELHFREFIDLTQTEPRLMYAYHYQDVHKKLIFRYDNASHKPALSHAEHKHTSQGVHPAAAPNLTAVIDEVLNS